MQEASWGFGVEALGDGVGDDGLAFSFRQFHQPPLLRHQRINLRRLPVQKRSDQGLLGGRRKCRGEVPNECVRNALLTARAIHVRFTNLPKIRRYKKIVKVCPSDFFERYRLTIRDSVIILVLFSINVDAW
jgi:hypothetical protein